MRYLRAPHWLEFDGKDKNLPLAKTLVFLVSEDFLLKMNGSIH